MRTLSLLLAGLLGVGLLTYLCANQHGPHFARDLSEKTKTALKVAGIEPAAVSGEGQIVTLRGMVTSEEIKRRAGIEAAKVWGVEEVRNLLTVVLIPAAPVMSVKERSEAVNCQAEFNKLLAREKIYFKTGKDEISPRSHRLLDALVTEAVKCPAAQISIEGHTDRRGSHEMNVKLSQRRAEAVEQYLVAKGVSKARLSAKGFGPDKPVADNKTAAGMEKNRRTEFRVKGL